MQWSNKFLNKLATKIAVICRDRQILLAHWANVIIVTVTLTQSHLYWAAVGRPRTHHKIITSLVTLSFVLLSYLARLFFPLACCERGNCPSVSLPPLPHPLVTPRWHEHVHITNRISQPYDTQKSVYTLQPPVQPVVQLVVQLVVQPAVQPVV